MTGAKSTRDRIVESMAGLLRACLRLTKNRDAAQDLAQETLLRALGAEDQFQPGTNINAWLCTIARNLHFNGFRGPRGFPIVPIDDVAPILLAPDRADAGDCIAGLGRALQTAAAILPPDHMRILALLADGETYEAVAAETRTPIGTVKSRVARTRELLRELIA